MKEHEKEVLQKIKAYAVQTLEFKGDIDYVEFSGDSKTIAACALNLSQIGELAARLDDDFIEKNSDIPWRKIRGMRNRIVHNYEGLQLNIVWDVLEDFIPELIDKLNKYNLS